MYLVTSIPADVLIRLRDGARSALLEPLVQYRWRVEQTPERVRPADSDVTLTRVCRLSALMPELGWCADDAMVDRLLDIGDHGPALCEALSEAARVATLELKDVPGSERGRVIDSILRFCGFAAGKLPVSEEQFEGAAEQIAESSIIDITKKAVVRLPQTLAAWEIPDDELSWDLELLHPYLERLRRLPLDTRGVLLVIVERGELARDDVALPITELELATGVRGKRLGAHLDMLDRHHIAGIEEDWEGRSWVGTTPSTAGGSGTR